MDFAEVEAGGDLLAGHRAVDGARRRRGPCCGCGCGRLRQRRGTRLAFALCDQPAQGVEVGARRADLGEPVFSEEGSAGVGERRTNLPQPLLCKEGSAGVGAGRVKRLGSTLPLFKR
ncbi:hypothetical protein GLA29479_1270 [Lysobacter antibioticus]|nr:hypothetical protein GLA29479_1270 [Lysobacter antibioticus]